jgi:menaquinone-dependent protoporphyrinogen oxidase
MTRRILLVYASRHGSTQEVAEAIAATLRDMGLEVDLRAMQDAEPLDTYDAIVLGAPIYNAKWHSDAHQFLSQHQAMLSRRPVFIFALGPLRADDAAMRGSRNQLEQELTQYPWLSPLASAVFGGAYDPAKFNMVERLLYGLSSKDHRDWDAIHTWAKAIPTQLIP